MLTFCENDIITTGHTDTLIRVDPSHTHIHAHVMGKWTGMNTTATDTA